MPERALNSLPLAFNPESPRSQLARRRMILGDKEAFRKSLRDVERDLSAVIHEVRRQPNVFFYPVGYFKGSPLLLDPHTDIPTPALVTFQHALERAVGFAARKKHQAEIEGFTKLQEELLAGGVGSSYVWNSPQDLGVQGYDAMSKLWVGTLIHEDGSPIVRVLDIPLDATIEEHQGIFHGLGRDDQNLHQPDDFLRCPLVFRADQKLFPIRKILETIGRIIHLPKDPESLFVLLFSPHTPSHPLAKKYGREILLHPHPDFILGQFFRELGMPKQACGGITVSSLFDLRPNSPIDRILRKFDGVSCYTCGQSQLRLQEMCPFCGLKRVC